MPFMKRRIYWKCRACERVHAVEVIGQADVREWVESPAGIWALWVHIEPAHLPEILTGRIQ